MKNILSSKKGTGRLRGSPALPCWREASYIICTRMRRKGSLHPSWCSTSMQLNTGTYQYIVT